MRGQYSAVGIATCYGLDGSRFGPGKGKYLLFYAPSSRMGAGGTLPVLKRLRHGFEHPSPSCAKVNSEWSNTPTPLLRLNGILQGDLYL